MKEINQAQPLPAATKWHWRPDGPAANNPLFIWPIALKKAISWLIDSWKPNSEYAIFIGLALVSWFYLQPDLLEMQGATLSTMSSAQWLWVAQVYARNLFFIVLFAGGLHVYFYTFKGQASELKYEARFLSPDSSRFTFGKQIYDNMWWSIASGATIWTFYEVILLWAQANQYSQALSWSDDPIWFIALFWLIPLWLSLHFYLGHRFLHWPPLYKISHIVHHRNINTGPWSGMSMHPIEHLIYLSSLLVHLFIASHPIHIFFHAYSLTVSAIFGHTGFDGLMIKGKKVLAIGHFHHQLHHRHFECNYGAAELPCDAWWGTFDDGSAEARLRMRERTKERTKRNKITE